MQRLMGYDWPGNVRELRNTIERAVILGGVGELRTEHLPPGFGDDAAAPLPIQTPVAYSSGNPPLVLPVGTTVDEAERQLILRTLESTGGNKTRAAEVLHISLKTLHNKLKEYGAGDLKPVLPIERS
jgi:DNA-binding NtrC family response regulator